MGYLGYCAGPESVRILNNAVNVPSDKDSKNLLLNVAQFLMHFFDFTNLLFELLEKKGLLQSIPDDDLELTVVPRLLDVLVKANVVDCLDGVLLIRISGE